MNEQTIEMQPEAYNAGQGSGAVNSVNGQTGDVVLTTSDIENTSDYQTGDEVDATVAAAVAGKQDTLTAGNNIQINGDTISATDTTYTAGNGLDLTGTEFSVDTTTIATKQSVDDEITARQNADNGLQGQIDAISASSDVTDIVGTKAELNAYDTSKLKDNDIIKVLQDESQNDETTYYRWSTTTQTFTLIGEEGPYYTKSAVDALLNAKQNTLTAGSNIQISGDTISATDTTYSNFTGTDGTSAGAAGLVPAPATTDAGKFLKADGTWATAGSDTITTLTTADYNYPTNNPTSVGLWLLPPGLYTADSSLSVKLGVSTDAPSEGRLWLVGKGYSGYMVIYRLSAEGDSRGGSAYIISTSALNPGAYVRGIPLMMPADNLTSTSTIQALSANQGNVLNTKINSLIKSGAGAPTTSTTGTVGQLYEDTTNGDLYICTAVSGSTYTWEEVGAGGGGGGSSITVLTTADYNYPSANPNGINPVALSSGIYKATNGMDIYINRDAARNPVKSTAYGDVYFVVDNDPQASSRAMVFYPAGVSLTDSYGEEVMRTIEGPNSGTKFNTEHSVLSSQSVKDNLTSTDKLYPLSANQGKVLNDNMNARVIGSLASAPTTSTAGAVGALVATVESGTGHLYICTDDTGGSYTWQLLV